MRRREVLNLLGGAAVSPGLWPLAARAQQSLPVIGFLHAASRASYAPYVAAFHQALAQQGFVDGRNVAIDFRWADDDVARLPVMAAELVQRRVAVIVAGGTNAALVAKAATATTPIVFTAGTDPVANGLVGSFNRPGGNTTGTLQFNDQLIVKRLEFLREMVPNAATIGMLSDETSASSPNRIAAVQTAAATVGQSIRIFRLARPDQFDGTFAELARDKVGGLLVPNGTLF